MKRRRALSEIDENVSPSLNFQAQSSEEQAIVELFKGCCLGAFSGPGHPPAVHRPMNITWFESGFSPGWSVASVATLAPF